MKRRRSLEERERKRKETKGNGERAESHQRQSHSHTKEPRARVTACGSKRTVITIDSTDSISHMQNKNCH